ncbi:hypothetical protein RVIR1_00050 [Candidatus Rickettsiella viridis]|uniref:Lipoprotein n=1 Tax=Candidatus Rickettsiella viridis TaxID=676208 RepID=A0A2Z5USU9_9COXI|nr:hypothetical protein [Candidatus Rickettsiella viridis]BBB14549.1 hypothetical protein RVIR1_00050 [Candidatus Rickettsiella viridis]
MKKFLFLLIAPFLLTACGPPLVFGIPQQQWDQLNQQQRSQVIAGYNKQKVAEAQMAPLTQAVNALSYRNYRYYNYPYYYPYHRNYGFYDFPF